MCHVRRVKHVYACGHSQNLPDELMRCEATDCKFSPNHPPNCVPPYCTKHCWQYRQFPEQYARQLPSLCPSCEHARRR